MFIDYSQQHHHILQMQLVQNAHMHPIASTLTKLQANCIVGYVGYPKMLNLISQNHYTLVS